MDDHTALKRTPLYDLHLSLGGKMVPFASFSTANWVYGSPRLERFNGLPAVEILGQPAPGKS